MPWLAIISKFWHYSTGYVNFKSLFLLFSLRRDIEESSLISRETVVMLTERNGCICSRLFTETGNSIVMVRA